MYHKLQGSNHVLRNTWSKVGGRSILERTLFMKESAATNLLTSPTSSSSLPVPPWAPFPLPNLVNLATWNSTSATTLPTLPSNSLRLRILKLCYAYWLADGFTWWRRWCQRWQTPCRGRPSPSSWPGPRRRRSAWSGWWGSELPTATDRPQSICHYLTSLSLSERKLFFVSCDFTGT